MGEVDQSKLEKALTDSVFSLCSSFMPHASSIEVRGLLGITLDKSNIVWVDLKQQKDGAATLTQTRGRSQTPGGDTGTRGSSQTPGGDTVKRGRGRPRTKPQPDESPVAAPPATTSFVPLELVVHPDDDDSDNPDIPSDEQEYIDSPRRKRRKRGGRTWTPKAKGKRTETVTRPVSETLLVKTEPGLIPKSGDDDSDTEEPLYEEEAPVASETFTMSLDIPVETADGTISVMVDPSFDLEDKEVVVKGLGKLEAASDGEEGPSTSAAIEWEEGEEIEGTSDVGRLVVGTGATGKGKRKPYQKYTSEQLSEALSLVRNKTYTVSQAAEHIGIPKSTLYDKYTNRRGTEEEPDNTPLPMGGKTTIPKELERRIAEHVVFSATFGYNTSCKQLQEWISDIVRELHLLAKPQSNFSGLIKHFRKRWSGVSKITSAASITQNSKLPTKAVVEAYFRELESILKGKNHPLGADQIYTIFDMELCMASSDTDDTSNVSFIAGASASGVFIPPFFVYKGTAEGQPELIDGIGIKAWQKETKTGKIDSSVIKWFLKECFLGGKDNVSASLPKLVLYDPSKSYIGVTLIDWAKEHNIRLFMLPASLSPLFDTSEIGCFNVVRGKIIEILQAITLDSQKVLTEKDICHVASKAYVDCPKVEVSEAFLNSGLYPSDPKRVQVLD